MLIADKKNYFYNGLLILVVLFAIVSRFYGVDRLSLWSDELWVVVESPRGSLWEMLRYVYYNDNHPPGYYLLSRYSQFLLGSSDFAIRLPSVLAGIALVYVVFFVGRKHYSREAGLIAAALVAGSYQGIFYSQEARANILLALFSLSSFYYFTALILEKKLSNKNYWAFWATATINYYLHYSGAVFVACLALFYGVMLLMIREKDFF